MSLWWCRCNNCAMANRSFPVVTIILFSIVFGETDNAGSSKPRYVSRGQDVTLKPLMTGTPTDILWTHNKNKAVEWDGNPAQPIYKEYNKFSGKVTLNNATGELTISGLTTDLSGLYEMEYTIDKMLHRYNESVEVLEPASKPEITCNRSNNTTTTLRCSAQGSLLQYRWSGPGLSKEQEESMIITTTEEGVYTCEVKNLVSREQRNFSTTTECGNQPPNSNAQTIAGAVVGTLVILLALVIGGVFWFKCFRNKKSSSDTDRPSPNPETIAEDQSSSLAVSDKGKVNPPYTSENVPLLQNTSNDDPQTKDNDNDGQKTREGNGTPFLCLESETRDDTSTCDTSVPEGMRDIPQGSPVSPGSAPPPKPPRLSLHVSNNDPTSENTTGGEEGEERAEQTDDGRDDCREEGGSSRAVDAGGEGAEEGVMSEEGQGKEDAREVQVESGGGEGVARVEGSERQNGTEDASEDSQNGSVPVSPGAHTACPSTAVASEEQDREEEESKEEGREEEDRMEEREEKDRGGVPS